MISMPDVRHHLQGAAHAARAGPGRPDCDKLRPEHAAGQPQALGRLVHETEHPQGEVTIAMVGKYVDLTGQLQVCSTRRCATPA